VDLDPAVVLTRFRSVKPRQREALREYLQSYNFSAHGSSNSRTGGESILNPALLWLLQALPIHETYSSNTSEANGQNASQPVFAAVLGGNLRCASSAIDQQLLDETFVKVRSHM